MDRRCYRWKSSRLAPSGSLPEPKRWLGFQYGETGPREGVVGRPSHGYAAGGNRVRRSAAVRLWRGPAVPPMTSSRSHQRYAKAGDTRWAAAAGQ